jgi:hypothetical protein
VGVAVLIEEQGQLVARDRPDGGRCPAVGRPWSVSAEWSLLPIPAEAAILVWRPPYRLAGVGFAPGGEAQVGSGPSTPAVWATPAVARPDWPGWSRRRPWLLLNGHSSRYLRATARHGRPWSGHERGTESPH